MINQQHELEIESTIIIENRKYKMKNTTNQTVY